MGERKENTFPSRASQRRFLSVHFLLWGRRFIAAGKEMPQGTGMRQGPAAPTSQGTKDNEKDFGARLVNEISSLLSPSHKRNLIFQVAECLSRSLSFTSWNVEATTERHRPASRESMSMASFQHSKRENERVFRKLCLENLS